MDYLQVDGIAVCHRTGVGLTSVRALSEVNYSLQIPRSSPFSSVQVHPVPSDVTGNGNIKLALPVKAIIFRIRWNFSCGHSIILIFVAVFMLLLPVVFR